MSWAEALNVTNNKHNKIMESRPITVVAEEGVISDSISLEIDGKPFFVHNGLSGWTTVNNLNKVRGVQ